MSFHQQQQHEPSFHPAVYDTTGMSEEGSSDKDVFVSLDVDNLAMLHHPFPHQQFPDMQNGGALIDAASATTNGSVYGGSRANKEQQQQQQQPHFVMGGDMSRSEEEMIKQVLEEHQVLAQTTCQGLEKLEAYVLPNDENVEPFERQSSMKTIQDEEFSLHLSRPTGTGSHQLELWIREVNLAVSNCKKGHFHHLSIETDDRMVAGGPQSRIALSPTKRNDLSPTKRNERSAFSPTGSTYPHYSQSFSPTKKKLPDKRGIKSQQWPENFPPNDIMQKTNLASPAISSTVQDSESNLIMASIEGKYKSLRDDLIRDPTFDEVASNNDDVDKDESQREEEEETHFSSSHRSKRSHRVPAAPTAASAASTQGAASPTPGGRIDFTVRDNHFNLGMLSTRSSGILSPNSYDSGSSFQSTLSGLSSYPEGKGCGLFLCD